MKSFLYLFCFTLLLISCSNGSEKDEEFVFLRPNRSFSESVCLELGENDPEDGTRYYYVQQNSGVIQLRYDHTRRQIDSETWEFDDLNSTDATSIREFLDKKNTTYTTIELIGYDSSFNFNSGARHQFALKDKSSWNLFECSLSITDDKNRYELNVTYHYLNEF